MAQRPLDFCETLYYTRNLNRGDHGIFLYRSPNEKREVAFNFFQAGLEKGEGAIYVASQETPKQIRRHMKDYGLDVKALEKDGVLKIFDYDGWYIIGGEVNAPHIMTMGLRVLDEAVEIGLKGLRGCGEVACFFEHKRKKQLMEYELMVGRKIDLPITALCAYDVNDAKSLDELSFFSLIHALGPVITHSFAQEVAFEEFLSTAIDETLESMFGKIGKKAIVEMLDERLSLTPDRFAEHPKALFEGLERVIGSGAHVVVDSIVTRMYAKIGVVSHAKLIVVKEES